MSVEKCVHGYEFEIKRNLICCAPPLDISPSNICSFADNIACYGHPLGMDDGKQKTSTLISDGVSNYSYVMLIYLTTAKKVFVGSIDSTVLGTDQSFQIYCHFHPHH